MVSIGIKVSSCSGRLVPRRLFFDNFTPYYRAMNSIHVVPCSRSRTTNIQDRSTDFTLTIFEEDFIRIQNLVSKIPYAETGGNLFGLWTNQGNAVVLVATGPGKNCKRSCASFYQDIPYMQQVGNLVTRKYPLCHIGEWHSHHQMELYEPSFGDCNTVQRNYPTGSQGFILVIANILRGNSRVKLSPYKFTDERSSYKRGDIEVVRAENPFMKVTQITSAIESGKENNILQPESSGIVTNEYTCLPDEKQNYKDKQLKRNHPSSPPNTRSLLPNKMLVRSSPHETQINHHMKKVTNQVDVKGLAKYPHRPAQPKNSSKPSPKRASGISGSSPSQSTFNTEKLQQTIPHIAGPKSHIASASMSGKRKQSYPAIHSTANLQERSQVQTDHEDISRYHRTTQWYEIQPETLRKTLDFVRSLADDQNTVNISRHKSTLDTTMTFTHHNYEWSIYFPADFPCGSVKLKKKCASFYYTYPVERGESIDSFKRKVNSTLQKECSTCKARHESPHAINSTANPQDRSQMPTQWYEIKPETLRKTLDFVRSLADDQNTVNISRDGTTLDTTMTFTHHNYEWSIDFPADFPSGSVKLKKKLRSFGLDTYHVEGRGNIDRFKAELKSLLQGQCARCKNYNTRYNHSNRYY